MYYGTQGPPLLANKRTRGPSALAHKDSGVPPYLGAPGEEGGRPQRRPGQFSRQGLSLGFGCLGIHWERVEELAGCGFGWGSHQAVPEYTGGRRGAGVDSLGLRSSRTWTLSPALPLTLSCALGQVP